MRVTMKIHRLVIMLTLPAAVVAGAPYGVAGQNAGAKVAVAQKFVMPDGAEAAGAASQA